MFKNMRYKLPSTSRIAGLTGILCIACCALPYVGMLVGLTIGSGLAIYLEKLSVFIFFVGVSIIVLKHSQLLSVRRSTKVTKR